MYIARGQSLSSFHCFSLLQTRGISKSKQRAEVNYGSIVASKYINLVTQETSDDTGSFSRKVYSRGAKPYYS